MKSLPRRYHQKGFILIVVLVLVMLLSVLLFGFNRKSLTRLETVESFQQFGQAQYCARAGLGIAVAAIRDINDLNGDPRFAKLQAGQEPFSIGEGTCTITITGTDGQLNVNCLKDDDDQLDRTRIDQLLRLIDLVNRDYRDSVHLSYGLVPALIDWVDTDNEITILSFVSRENQGAENSYYATLKPAYRCRNKSMETIDELSMVKGITPKAAEILRDLLTTNGEGKININTAPKLVIECLSEEMDPALAQVIIQQRQRKPFANVSELRNAPGMTDNIYEAIRSSITTDSDEQYYRVSTSGKAGNRICEIEALLRRNTKAGNVDIVLYRES